MAVDVGHIEMERTIVISSLAGNFINVLKRSWGRRGDDGGEFLNDLGLFVSLKKEIKK